MKIHHRFGDLLNNTDGMQIIAENFISLLPPDLVTSQEQTKNVFTDKWDQYNYGTPEFKKMVAHQKNWYLELYGFNNESELAEYLRKCSIILDAGAGTCYKAAWFAELSPNTLVVAADISGSLNQAARNYSGLENILFVRCDIGSMPFFNNGLFDYISCDQVIHHTADPYKTFKELVRLTGLGKELSVYVYRKKSLPRELLDNHFRELSSTLSHDQLMDLSEKLTDLGQLLSSIEGKLNFPDIPVLEIEGGEMTLQRFIYWNFIKCFWNDELGHHNSVMTNYDWYSPSQASRYSEQEFKKWITDEKLITIHFHREQACYSGRFSKS